MFMLGSNTELVNKVMGSFIAAVTMLTVVLELVG